MRDLQRHHAPEQRFAVERIRVRRREFTAHVEGESAVGDRRQIERPQVDEARAFDGELTVQFNDTRIPLEDAAEVPPELRGYVQLALDLPLMNAFFTLEQGPFDLIPEIKARFKPSAVVTRAGYASFVNHYFDVYRQSIDD